MREISKLVDEWKSAEKESNLLTFPLTTPFRSQSINDSRSVGRPHKPMERGVSETQSLMEEFRESLIKYFGEHSEPLIRRMSHKELMYAHLLQRHTDESAK